MLDGWILASFFFRVHGAQLLLGTYTRKKKNLANIQIDSISVALSCLVCVPPREELRGRSAGSFPEQRLVIEPNIQATSVVNNRDVLFDHNVLISGIVVAGYSPLGSNDRPKGMIRKDDPVVLNEPVLKKIADKHNTTVALVS